MTAPDEVLSEVSIEIDSTGKTVVTSNGKPVGLIKRLELTVDADSVTPNLVLHMVPKFLVARNIPVTVVKESPISFDFIAALDALRCGKRVTRRAWPEGVSLVFDGSTYLLAGTPWSAMPVDMTACDWVVLD